EQLCESKCLPGFERDEFRAEFDHVNGLDIV
ncbi:MAG: hypothetical protein ACI957_002382, partial [Verrucomicrobiales bacterium]